jgi:2-desacetyl-2-hydroxyethyl bacteriochlorophyllide A dehydrogenase
VEHIQVGARVTVDNAIYCGNCEFCRNNQEHLCVNFRSLGVTQNGGFAEYVVADQTHVYDIGDLSYDEASLTEPLSCAIHGIKLLAMVPGVRVLIFGAGPAGLLLLQLARHAGASGVVLTDPNQFKLNKAKDLGAASVVVADRTDHARNRRNLLDLSPLGYECVIDATGRPEVQQNAVSLVKKGGKLLLFGLASNESQVKINPYEILIREISIIGSNCQLYDFSPAVKVLKAGVVKTAPLITHKLKLSQFAEAFDIAKNSHEKLKIVINP